ncbi:MAG: 2-C-methyl-D-erythritol 2,4-cyclodiphosphate synthase [Treponema sp.]|jgi:2-C-methyl-D-erythritol 4-phosphate cytidylyltransferase/2-C-methyl-D-erythritol 2,4-cyclodiphosphate synthase|nr:2-C-methyl-D-erythritol 2,4-cyclodiphosphate synthase [Treponema sp.]
MLNFVKQRVSVAAIVCAAGSSSRMGTGKKEYLPLSGEITVLGAAAAAFASCPQINTIVITVPAGEESIAKSCLPKEILVRKKGILFVEGGPTRRSSVHKALSLLDSYHPTHVLIHDGARPWVKRDLIERCIEAAIRYGAAIPAIPLVETPKELGDDERFIKRHLRRTGLCTAQTPQGFAFPEILRAHEKAAKREEKENYEYTDDAEVWGEFAGQVTVIPGDAENRKITFPEDLETGQSLIFTTENTEEEKEGKLCEQRIGLGRDIHRLTAGRRFLLGGVEIPFEKGEDGHSDGDALAHAVCDALLGAAGLGDIGELYPPDDPAWKDANSIELLKGAWRLVRTGGWRLVNLDCTVNCERPKLLPHRESIRQSLAQALDVEPGAVFVKGKTNEGLGPVGAGEAVEALAICLIEKR